MTMDFDQAYAAEQIRRRSSPLRRLIKSQYLANLTQRFSGPTIDLGCGAGQLLERLPAGSEGNVAPRALVRSVAGPMALDGMVPGQRLTHLRALRWPDTAKPERLQARAWLEAPDGRIIAMAADGCH